MRAASAYVPGPILGLLTVMGAAALGGCSFDASTVELPVNECGGPSDCPRGSCDRERHMCITEETQPVDVALELTRNLEIFGSSPPSVTVQPFSVSGPQTRDVELPGFTEVVGRVEWTAEGASAPERVPARVRFVRAASVPGSLAAEFETTTASTRFQAEDEAPADYEMQLSAGLAYDVAVYPTGEAAHKLPPLRRDDVEIPEFREDRFQTRVDVTYPSNLETIQGVVVSRDAEGRDIPQQGLRVRAVGRDTGRLVSSTAVTGSGKDQPKGHFSLRLSPHAEPYLLRITAGEDRPLFPTITINPDLFFAGSKEPRVLVPRGGSVTLRGFVEAPPHPDRNDVGVDGAVLEFDSDEIFDRPTRVSGSFRTTVTSEATNAGEGSTADGRRARYEVELPPGRYDVVVTPPGSRNDLSVLVDTVTVSPERAAPGLPDECGAGAQCGKVFELPQRVEVGGEVRTMRGVPVPNATVQARALGESLAYVAGREARFNRSGGTTTNLQGRFALPLDLGLYDLRIEPPSGTRFPWVVRTRLRVGMIDPPTDGSFETRAPVPVRGKVTLQHNGKAAGNTEIKAYVLLKEDGPAREGDDATRAVQIGRTVTDSDGRYELLLPPRPLGR